MFMNMYTTQFIHLINKFCFSAFSEHIH